MASGAHRFRRPGRPSPRAASPRRGFRHVIEPLERRQLLSAAPLAPDLLAASDSGVSGTDNITRFDNGTAAAALQFVVGGTTAGAVVGVYVDGQPAGTATADGLALLASWAASQERRSVRL